MTSPTPWPTLHLPPWRLPLAYLLAAVFFLAIDAVWLSLAAAPLYQPAIGHLMSPQVDWAAAAAFYALYVAGLVFFAVAPALVWRRPAVALRRGAFLGLLAYATYDLTNQALLRDWPWHVTLADLAWGTFASGAASWAAAAATLGLVHSRRKSAPVPART